MASPGGTEDRGAKGEGAVVGQRQRVLGVVGHDQPAQRGEGLLAPKRERHTRPSRGRCTTVGVK